MPRLACRACGASIRADDMDLGQRLAKCAACHEVFHFTVDDAGIRAGGAAPDSAVAVPLPRRFMVHETTTPPRAGGYRDNALPTRALRIWWRWYTPQALFMVLFCLFWNGFLLFWYTGGTPTGFKIFALGHVAVGVFLTYTTAAKLFNRTTIVVDADALRIEHAPLPWRGAGVYPARELAQLYCRRDEHRGKNGVTIDYSVHALCKDGSARKLISGLPEPEEALFLEHKIERALELRDTPVAGEYRG
jgi:hypothetical protein